VPLARRSRSAITRITSCAKYGVWWTRTQNIRAEISTRSASEAAVAVSARGWDSINASSPNRFGACTVSSVRSPSLNATVPLERMNIASPARPLLEDHLAGGHPPRLTGAREQSVQRLVRLDLRHRPPLGLAGSRAFART